MGAKGVWTQGNSREREVFGESSYVMGNKQHIKKFAIDIGVALTLIL